MRSARVLLPAAWMGVLWFLSSIPAHSEGHFVGFAIPALIQNGAHLIVYAILAACWFWALGTKSDAVPRLVGGLSLGYGVIDEVHQAFVPGRTCSLLDLFLDGIGIACVIWAVRAFHRHEPTTLISDTPLPR